MKHGFFWYFFFNNFLFLNYFGFFSDICSRIFRNCMHFWPVQKKKLRGWFKSHLCWPFWFSLLGCQFVPQTFQASFCYNSNPSQKVLSPLNWFCSFIEFGNWNQCWTYSLEVGFDSLSNCSRQLTLSSQVELAVSFQVHKQAGAGT